MPDRSEGTALGWVAPGGSPLDLRGDVALEKMTLRGQPRVLGLGAIAVRSSVVAAIHERHSCRDVTPDSYRVPVSDYRYYRYRPQLGTGNWTVYRCRNDCRTGGETTHEVYDWQSGQWAATDSFAHKMIRGEFWIDHLDFDFTPEWFEIKGDEARSMSETVGFLIEHPESVGGSYPGEFALGVVEQCLPEVLARMIDAGRRWVVILETLSDPAKYVQVLITSSGSLWAECVSNQFLDDEHRLDDAQCELLPTLGWEWPGPPAHPNWHLHDELLDTGPVMAGLMTRTVRRVFEIGDDDRIRVIMRPLPERREVLGRR